MVTDSEDKDIALAIASIVTYKLLSVLPFIWNICLNSKYPPDVDIPLYKSDSIILILLPDDIVVPENSNMKSSFFVKHLISVFVIYSVIVLFELIFDFGVIIL